MDPKLWPQRPPKPIVKKVLLRLPKDLLERIKSQAEYEYKSATKLIVEILEKGVLK